MWFANNNVDQFTIAVWLNRAGPRDGTMNTVLFTGDCKEYGAYRIYATDVDIWIIAETGDAGLNVEDEVNIAHN